MRDDQPRSQRLASRPATIADVLRYYGERPRQTLKAVVVTLNDEPVGIIGLAQEGRCLKLFSEFQPVLRDQLRCMTVLRAIKKAMSFVKAARLPVVAITQENEPDSPRILERLGFKFHSHSDSGDVYEWLG